MRLKYFLDGVRPAVLALILCAALPIAKLTLINEINVFLFLALLAGMRIWKKSPIFYEVYIKLYIWVTRVYIWRNLLRSVAKAVSKKQSFRKARRSISCSKGKTYPQVHIVHKYAHNAYFFFLIFSLLASFFTNGENTAKPTERNRCEFELSAFCPHKLIVL